MSCNGAGGNPRARRRCLRETIYELLVDMINDILLQIECHEDDAKHIPLNDIDGGVVLKSTRGTAR